MRIRTGIETGTCSCGIPCRSGDTVPQWGYRAAVGYHAAVWHGIGSYRRSTLPQTVTEKDMLESVNKVIKGYAKFSATPKYMVYN